ncbi:EutN/CcmL family microcompartment protein [Neobacillus niacini]|uniref:EutN/CcmL family microcompartment protein n=1 Tax=Neobacillus niacini TaxID=86668 RepID=UPI00203F3953|nr:EutN/CcmL family microcompartment protein [Neobacillus niacini]MCM3691887.1 EutN/CcmL family microcompartment protein [Neobacillus niacini]
MFIAKVIGKVVATQKAEKLVGSKLLVIKSINENQQFSEENALVAVDRVGAGMGDIVLVDWGDSLYEEAKLAADMAIVGIIDEIQMEGK